MSLRRFNILLLLIASVWSTTILADESSGINLDGLQLAFTRYKRSPVTEEPTTQEAPSKPPTPLPAAVPQQEIKPVTAPKVKPAPTPITEPAITQTIKSTESKQTANQSPRQ
jgi:outer membrane biosynthesis protein TonB